MVGDKTDSREKMAAGVGRVVNESGSLDVPLVRPAAPAARSSASAYVATTLPISLSKPAIPPWARELTRLLDRRGGAREELANLRAVERLMRMPGVGLPDLPDEVVRAAGLELRWLARRDEPSPALARLLDQFENELLTPALRRLQRAREGAGR